MGQLLIRHAAVEATDSAIGPDRQSRPATRTRAPRVVAIGPVRAAVEGAFIARTFATHQAALLAFRTGHIGFRRAAEDGNIVSSSDELDDDDPMPKPFAHVVHAPDYSESWVEGMVVLHNPKARIPLDPSLIPRANHEFLKEDGGIMSLLPGFHPYFSQTAITIEDDDNK